MEEEQKRGASERGRRRERFVGEERKKRGERGKRRAGKKASPARSPRVFALPQKTESLEQATAAENLRHRNLRLRWSSASLCTAVPLPLKKIGEGTFKGSVTAAHRLLERLPPKRVCSQASCPPRGKKSSAMQNT